VEIEPDEVHVWVVEVPRGKPEEARQRMREIVAASLQTTPDRVEIRADERGKPQLAGRELEFNLSYSGELALVAVARVAVGVDVEQVEEIDDELPELVDFVLSRRERRQLMAVAADDRVAAYYRAFTRKEAYVKATGEGMSGRPLPEVECDLAKPELVAVAGVSAGELKRWSVFELEPTAGYVGALVVAHARPRVTERSWPQRRER
jgi:4'-phosphopantetheinyl transferase